MLGILVERARAVEDLLILLVVVALGSRLVNSGDDMVWLVAAILTRLRALWPIMATVPMMTAVIVAVVIVASVVGAIIAAASWAMNALILVEAHFGFFDVDVLVGGRNHLANPCGLRG